jgi:hypothetical protein
MIVATIITALLAGALGTVIGRLGHDSADPTLAIHDAYERGRTEGLNAKAGDLVRLRRQLDSTAADHDALLADHKRLMTAHVKQHELLDEIETQLAQLTGHCPGADGEDGC